MFRRQVVALVLMTVTLVQQCQGHGYLLDPPGRSSMWRLSKFKPYVIPNYTDMGLRCGGSRSTCGVCGDPVNGPFENEAGGIYASGLIAKEYTEGQTIKVTIVVTANHEGWFQFHLCPNNDFSKRVTEECLMSNVLKLSNGETKYYLQKNQYDRVDMEMVLPPGVTCSQCVFRWKWITQITGLEQFYGCADVSIAPREGGVTPRPAIATTGAPVTEEWTPRVTETEAPVTEEPITETRAPTTEEPIPVETEAPVTQEPFTEEPITEETEAPTTERLTPGPMTLAPWIGQPWKPIVDGHRVPLLCRAIKVWKNNAEMDEWCNNNCNNYQYNCPVSLCECVQRL